MNRQKCRCTSGDCSSCVCARNRLVCQASCTCSPVRCVTRVVVNVEERQERMDNDALNAALAAIAANQQQQQNVLAALANLVTAGPVVAPVGPAVPVPVTLDVGVKYSGGSSESLTEWLQLINRKATTQHWGDDERRRAAIGSLYGQALTWHDEIGVNIADWTDWVGGLRAAFETQLTESQWQTLVESRSQFATESGSTYVLEKLRICRRRSTPLTEPQMIPYLIRGLYNPAHQSVMMVNPPATITDFLAELRRLEAISFVPVVSPPNPPSCPQPTSPNSSSDSILRALEALTVQVSFMARNGSRPVDPTPTHSLPGRPVVPNLTSPYPAGNDSPSLPPYGYARRPPGARNEDQCYNCRAYGHFSRNCPHPNPRYPKPAMSENLQAGPLGQGRP